MYLYFFPYFQEAVRGRTHERDEVIKSLAKQIKEHKRETARLSRDNESLREKLHQAQLVIADQSAEIARLTRLVQLPPEPIEVRTSA